MVPKVETFPPVTISADDGGMIGVSHWVRLCADNDDLLELGPSRYGKELSVRKRFKECLWSSHVSFRWIRLDYHVRTTHEVT